MIKNPFYLLLKAFFILEIKKAMVNFEVYDVNINYPISLEVKVITMKFGQLIKYSHKKYFSSKIMQKMR